MSLDLASEDATPGWFGKLPMLGDFAKRRLPPAVVERWDDWLARAIAESHRELGADWLDTYLSAPIWAWAASPGLFGERWWCGLLMPSVDAVGRYFPVVLAAEAAGVPWRAEGYAAFGRWAEALAAAALQALRPDATLEGFEAALGQVPPTSSFADAAPSMPLPRNGRGEWVLPLPSDVAGWEAWPAQAWASLATPLGGRSLWWPMRGTAADAGITVVEGLPAPERYTAMLSGQL